MKARTLLLSLVVMLAAMFDAHAEQACKTTALKNPAPTLAEMYALAEGHAKAWKADAVPTQIATRRSGCCSPTGARRRGTCCFYSESAKAHIAIDTFRGSLNCFADPGSAGRHPGPQVGFRARRRESSTRSPRSRAPRCWPTVTA